MAAACCSQDRYNSGNLEVPCAVCTFLWSAGTIPKFEQDTDVRKLLNLYIYIFKELVQISREIIFERGLVSHKNLDRICENLTEYVKTL